VYLDSYPRLLKWFEKCQEEITNNYKELNDGESLKKIEKMLEKKENFKSMSKNLREKTIKELN